MKIYFAGSIRGGRQQQPIYAAIVDRLSQRHEVLTTHVAAKNVDEMESCQTDAEIFAQDTAWIRECDLMIAEVSVPSLGVGYEIAYAQHVANVPVLCVYQDGANVSAMITGCPDVRLAEYTSAEDAIDIIEDFLEMMSM